MVCFTAQQDRFLSLWVTPRTVRDFFGSGGASRHMFYRLSLTAKVIATVFFLLLGPLLWAISSTSTKTICGGMEMQKLWRLLLNLKRKTSPKRFSLKRSTSYGIAALQTRTPHSNRNVKFCMKRVSIHLQSPVHLPEKILFFLVFWPSKLEIERNIK